MTVAHRTDHTWSSPATRRVGYVISIAINAVFLYVAQNVVAWEWPPFVTAQWEDVLPILSVSLMAAIVVNVLYMFYDAGWFKSLTQIVTLAISMAVAIQMFRVFPFDFSSYGFNWELVTKGVLVIGAVGCAIGIIVEASKLFRELAAVGD